MKNYFRVLVIFILTVFAAARVTPHNQFETGLLKMIEQCRDGVVDSLPVACPALQPLKIAPIEFDYEEYTVSISELNVKGLENLSVEKLSSSPSDLSLLIEILVPTLAIRADWYHLHAKVLWLFNLVDDRGIFKCSINNLVARARIQFGSAGFDTVIRSLNLDYRVDDSQVHLSGSSQQVNDQANKKISKLMTDGNMKVKLQEKVIDLLSGYLKGYMPDEFIEIISNI